MGKIDLALLVGEESKKWLARLEVQLDRLEQLSGKVSSILTKGKKVKDEEEEDDNGGEEEEEETVKPVKRGKKSLDEDDKEEDDEDDKEEDDEEEEEDDDVEKEEDDEEVSDDEDDSDDDDDDDEPKPMRKTKGKTPTIKDVNAACKARARVETKKGKKGFNVVKKILLKKFKTASISEIDKSKFAAVIAVMKG